MSKSRGFYIETCLRCGQMEPGTAEREALNYLICNAVGHENAKAWPRIEEHLRVLNITTMTKKDFQQGLVTRSRRENWFIGSNDNGKYRGFFIIEKLEDVLYTAGFKERRILSEIANYYNLSAHCKGQFGRELPRIEL